MFDWPAQVFLIVVSAMQKRLVRKIVIAGGGTAGWMAAAAISEKYKTEINAGRLEIVLIESSSIGTVGVGEATVPGILSLHQHLGISEREFIKQTGATFKLGIEFRDWYKAGHHFFHPFAAFGTQIENQDFYQCWLKLFKAGQQFNLEDFCLAISMARQGRFAQPDDDAKSVLALYSYAYHFDASRYARFLKQYAQARKVRHIDALIEHVELHENSGEIKALVLNEGRREAGDLFIDCSGFSALLIEKALNTDYIDWQKYLPCDRAVAVQCELREEPLPYTRSIAMSAGWRWQIPLQNRMGNGYVYSSKHCADQEAIAVLLSNLEGTALNDARVIQFAAGMREKFWVKNCVALGLASGFIEPLESTSISLIQTGIEKLLQFMPDLHMDEKNQAEANRLNKLEYERIRDFIILHYKASMRDDSSFWNEVRQADIPDSLQSKIEAFERDGSILLMEQESFREQSWIAMYNGFKRIPKACQSGVDVLDTVRLGTTFEKMRNVIRQGAMHAPTHREFLESV